VCGGLVRAVQSHALAVNRYLFRSQGRFGVTSSKRKHDWNGDRMKLCVLSLNNTEFSCVQLTFIGSLCLSNMTFYAQVVKKSVLWSGDSYKKYSNRNVIRKIFLLFFLLSRLSNCLIPSLLCLLALSFSFSCESLFSVSFSCDFFPSSCSFSSSFSLSCSFSLPKSLLLFLLLVLFIIFFVSNSASVLVVLNHTGKYRHSEGDKPVMQCCAGIPAPFISWNNWVTKLTVGTGRQFVQQYYDKKASAASLATYCYNQAKVKDCSALKFESCYHVIHYEKCQQFIQ